MRVHRSGNSLALRIPSSVAQQLGVEVGAEFRVTFDGESIVLHKDEASSAYSWQAGKLVGNDLQGATLRRSGTPALADLLEARRCGNTVAWLYASLHGVDHTFRLDLE